MSVRSFRRRLQGTTLRLRERAYGRLAALWPGPLRPEEHGEAVQLVDWARQSGRLSSSSRA
jgi:hypothetical protein